MSGSTSREEREMWALGSIADSLKELTRMYRKHVQLTAKTARLSIEPLRRNLDPATLTPILDLLDELEDL